MTKNVAKTPLKRRVFRHRKTASKKAVRSFEKGEISGTENEVLFNGFGGKVH